MSSRNLLTNCRREGMMQIASVFSRKDQNKLDKKQKIPVVVTFVALTYLYQSLPMTKLSFHLAIKLNLL